MTTRSLETSAPRNDTINANDPITLRGQCRRAWYARAIYRRLLEHLEEFLSHDGRPPAERIWDDVFGEFVGEEAIRAFAAEFATREETARVLAERLSRQIDSLTQ